MNSRLNQILIGVILLLVGVVLLTQSLFKINYTNIIFICVGFAFLLLYKTKRKSWSLIVGSYLSYAGFLSLIGRHSAYYNVFASAMFFFVPAIIFMVLYFQKNKRGLLLPGSLLLWFSIYIILSNFIQYRSVHSVLFFICLSFSFFMVYLFGKHFIGKWVLYIGTFTLLLGFLSLLKIRPNFIYFNYLPQIGSVLLILFSIYIIVKAFINKQQ